MTDPHLAILISALLIVALGAGAAWYAHTLRP